MGHRQRKSGGDTKNPRDTVRYIVRASKKDSAFIYSQLEANEGLCFYSTLEGSEGSPMREVEVIGHRSLKVQLDGVLAHLEQRIYFELV